MSYDKMQRELNRHGLWYDKLYRQFLICLYTTKWNTLHFTVTKNSSSSNQSFVNFCNGFSDFKENNIFVHHQLCVLFIGKLKNVIIRNRIIFYLKKYFTCVNKNVNFYELHSMPQCGIKILKKIEEHF